MLARRASLLALFIGVLFLRNLLAPAQVTPDFWKNWLDEVAPIMTKTERAVFKNLQTEEERTKFQSFFWKVRDATPGTPENEFRTEFYSRRRYAENRLGGAQSDRGRIYVILGKPAEAQDFSGLDNVVDCELWIYRGEGRSGLPPLMYLLFYRQDAAGEYKLYYPGMNSALDLLSPGMKGRRVSISGAYRMIQASYPELAKATLSVIPDEANSAFPTTLNSSGQTIGMIFTLPEREVEKSYLKYFSSPPGTVDVSYTTKEVAGKAAVFITDHQGVKFLNYALMPDRISTARTKDGFETAHLVFHLQVEDKAGRTIHQQDKEIRLRLDGPKAEAMRQKKLIFSDFAPVIEGEFRVRLTYTNKTSEEFFVLEQDIVVNDGTPSLVIGYQVKEKNSESLLPFSLGQFKVLLDPRSIFSRRDSLEGLVRADDPPELLLVDRDKEAASIPIREVSKQGEAFVFRQPLAGMVPGNYDFVVKMKGAEVFRRTLYLLSFDVEKPLVFERTEPLSYLTMLPFVVGQEYLNAGRVEKALESFEKLPPRHWNGTTLPVIARALYLNKDYARVVELLEREQVEKSYPVLILLGNSSLALKKLDKAAFYFEEVRKFGDTAEANNALGAIYFSLGDKDKAKVYWERAKKLEQKSADKSPQSDEKRKGSSEHAEESCFGCS
jgi:GWxTD domain-containing protein